MTVQPDGDAAFRALEGDKDALADHLRRHKERLDIAGDRVVLLRDFANFHLLIAVPRILHVGILRRTVSLHLDMRRNMDIRPAAAVVIRRFKARDDLTGVQRMVEFPKPIKRLAQAGLSTGKFFHVRISHMVGMRRDPILLEECGVFKFACVKVHSLFPFDYNKQKVTSGCRPNLPEGFIPQTPFSASRRFKSRY